MIITNPILNLLSVMCFVFKEYKIKSLFITVLLFQSFGVIAQTNFSPDMEGSSSNEKQFYKVISFGEKIDFGNVENSVRWTITNPKESILVNLNGKKINEYVFEKPGIYDISFFEDKTKSSDECHHPMFKEKMRVKVSSVKMIFDFSKIQFSQKIQRGRNYDDIVITVPVNITFKENSQVKFEAPGLQVSGIGTELIAKPINKEIIVKNGVQLLQYQLSGIVNKETYLMFDFLDLNNEVQTYNHLEIIN